MRLRVRSKRAAVWPHGKSPAVMPAVVMAVVPVVGWVGELGEGGVVVQAGPDDQGVDEEADQGEGWGLAAVGDEGADRDVVLAAVAGQQGLESGQRGHEHGGVLGAGEPA